MNFLTFIPKEVMTFKYHFTIFYWYLYFLSLAINQRFEYVYSTVTKGKCFVYICRCSTVLRNNSRKSDAKPKDVEATVCVNKVQYSPACQHWLWPMPSACLKLSPWVTNMYVIVAIFSCSYIFHSTVKHWKTPYFAFSYCMW